MNESHFLIKIPVFLTQCVTGSTFKQETAAKP